MLTWPFQSSAYAQDAGGATISAEDKSMGSRHHPIQFRQKQIKDTLEARLWLSCLLILLLMHLMRVMNLWV